MRKSREWNNILDDCLERLLVQGESIEDCLRSYPEHADELRPLLDTVLSIKQASGIEPRPEFSARARYQFRVALQEAKAKRSRFFFGWQPVWATALTAVLVLLLASSATVAAAGNSMPDETLYPVKLAAERVQLMVTTSSLGKAELHAKLADRRVAEIIHLANKGKPERIKLTTQRLDVSLAQIAVLSRVLVKGEGETGVFQAPPPRMLSPRGTPEMAAGVTENQTPPRAPSAQARGKQAAPGRQIKDKAKLKAAVARSAATHPKALREALKKAPKSVRPALQRAIEVSEGGYKKARQALD